MMDKKYDHLSSEAQAQALWHKENTYAAEHNPGPLYSIDTPPPTVSGSLHIGHVFSYTQTDIIARYKRMCGLSVFYPFGFDDNGLPTERFVEKKKEINAHSMKRSEFIALCLAETVQVEKQFEDLWKRLGLSVDWSLCYSTIDERSRKISQESFIELYKKGYIYRKDEPALYCTNCRTTVAQAELDDLEKNAHFNDIVFTGPNNEKLIIGTTRPELLSSCVALFYHPDDARYKHLEGKTAKVPVYANEVPILADDAVDPAKGTGLVMCCTFGDKTDIVWYKKYNLPYRQSIGLDGKWVSETGPLAGMRAATARETIIKHLQEAGLLVQQKPVVHTVNVHERCKKDIEYLILKQWFLEILPYKKEFLELADQINWYPSFMKARYKNWVENINWDWCLSRQRFYGIPFPVWHCLHCGDILLADPKDLPVDPQETTYPGQCPKCGSDKITPDTDVMDTWNTSSLTPYLCLSLFKKSTEDIFAPETSFLPMSMRPQAHDIIRTWAFYTIVKSWMHTKNIPWHDIIISGHVLSTEKEKISKSKGNSPLAPETLLSTLPADALRYWTASGTLGTDIAFSEAQIAIGQKLLVKLWNAFRFAQPYLGESKLDEPQTLGVVNEWILEKVSKTYHDYTHYFEKNEFSLALDVIERFFWADYCDNYLELIKDQLFNPQHYVQEEIAATHWTLYHVGLRILQLYAPFVPHITETLYGLLYKEREKVSSIHQVRFAQVQKDFSFAQSSKTLDTIIDIIGQVRKLKTQHQVSLKTDLATLSIFVEDAENLAALQSQESLIKGATKAITLSFAHASETKASHMTQDDNQWHAEIVLP